MKSEALLFLLILPFTLGVESTSPSSKCEPDCTGKEPGVMVEDPMDCHKFYFCMPGNLPTDTPFSCNPGEHFENDTCVIGAECKNTCGPGGGCTFSCDGGKEFAADRYDCSRYTQCNGGSEVSMTCDPGLFFDGESCQKDESLCCSCRPICETADLYSSVSDPTNCTNFYFCAEEGVPEYASTCASGNFDPFSHMCSDSAPCIVFCTNVVGSNGCIDTFTCEEPGYFYMCKEKCDPHYYYCKASDIGNTVSPKKCDGDLVFNPDTMHCVPANQCNYPTPSPFEYI